jgi:hypothetical protein
MKRLALSLCLLMLVPPAVLAAAPSLQCSTAKSSNGPSPEFAPEGQLPFSAGEHLVFDAGELAGKADMEVRYFLDGQLHLTENLPLKSLKPAAEPAEGGPSRTVVELLAMRPAERKLLATIGRTEPGRVSVEIRQGGALLRSLSLAQLQKEGEALLEAPFRPEVVKSQVSGKGKRDHPKKSTALFIAADTCEGGCATQRDQCYADFCPGMDYCEECELQYQQCVQGCQPPPPPPTCQYKEEYYWTSLYPWGSNVFWWDQICYPDQIWYFYDGLWHVRVERVYRRDLIKKTTYTDCTTSQQVVGYEYWSYQCYDWTSSSCYTPWYPFNTCY